MGRCRGIKPAWVGLLTARRVVSGALAAGAIAAIAGCGASDEDEVKDTVRSYLSAVADGDGDEACDQLTGDAKRQFADSIAAQVPSSA